MDTDSHQPLYGDYRKGKSATSLPQYITLLKEDLIPKLIQEDDASKRKSIGKAVSDRLTNINNVVRPMALAKEANKRAVLNIISHNEKSKQNGILAKENPAYNLLEESGFKNWLEGELKADEKLISTIKRHVDELETEKQMLKEALFRRESILESKTFKGRHGDTKIWQSSDEMSMQERISMLESVVKKQDDEVHLLKTQLDDENTKYVHIDKEDYEEMMVELKPCVKKLNEYYEMANEKLHNHKKSGKNQLNFTLGKSLKENVLILVEQIEKMRGRVEQTTEALKGVEKEKEICLQLLNKNNNCILSKVLEAHLKQWTDEKHYLNQEIKSLRRNIDTLAEKNRSLMEDIESMTKSKGEESSKVATPRVRRSSAPLSAKSNGVKPQEKKSSVVTVGVQPKIMSFGDPTLSSVKSKAVRKKSSISTPFKP